MGSVGEDPPGTAEAADGLGYVEGVLGDLESLERELRGLLQMNWRSEAADEFAEYLSGCIRRVEQTAGEYQGAAEVLKRYATELQLLDTGEWS